MSTTVWPTSAPVSAVKARVNVPLLPAGTWSGVTSTRPIPSAAGGAGAGTSSSASPRTGASARRQCFVIDIGPLRIREAEVKQPSDVAVWIRRMEHHGDQALPAALRGGNEAVPRQRRPAGLDAVRAAVGGEELVL